MPARAIASLPRLLQEADTLQWARELVDTLQRIFLGQGPDSIDGSAIINESIPAGKLQKGAVRGSAGGSLTENEIRQYSIWGDRDIADASITGRQILDGSITGAEILDASITGADLANNTIGSQQLAIGASVSAAQAVVPPTNFAGTFGAWKTFFTFPALSVRGGPVFLLAWPGWFYVGGGPNAVYWNLLRNGTQVTFQRHDVNISATGYPSVPLGAILAVDWFPAPGTYTYAVQVYVSFNVGNAGTGVDGLGLAYIINLS